MIWRVIAFLFALSAPAAAETIQLRSGEHDGFSRIVMPLPDLDTWSIEKTENGYVLHSGVANAEFAMQSVFRFIPKTRLLALEQGTGGRLFLQTAPDTKAEAFTLAPDLLVIDLYSDVSVPPRDGKTSTDAQVTELPPRPISVQPVVVDQTHLDVFWKAEPSPAHPHIAASAPQVQLQDRAHALPLQPEPDAQLAEIEDALARQLARASAQGLVKLDMPKLPTNDDMPADASSPSKTEQTDEPLSKPDDHIAFNSMTVIDRDQLHERRLGRTKSGRSCPADALFDISRWIDDRSPLAQISEARRGLLGEFDVPDQNRVISLARVYIAFGFGAEARALLRDLSQPGDAREALFFLGAVLDEDATAAQSPFATMSECDGFVALWAFLGADPSPRNSEVNFSAIQRTFRSLPASLRQAIAPRLTERLTQIGASDIARSLRPALARATQEDVHALEVVDAQLAADAGSDSTEPKLRRILHQSSPDGLQSLLLLIDHQLSEGNPVDTELIEAAEAFAYELEGGQEIQAIDRAIMLAQASNGRFEEALAGFSTATDAKSDAEDQELLARLFEMLAHQQDDAVFITALYANPQLTQRAARNPTLREAIAERLLGIGLTDAAIRVITTADNLSRDDRLLLAQASLAGFDPSSALAHLNGLEGAHAAQLRAEALSRLGQHGAARDAYEQVGNASGAEQEAWREADWTRALETDDPVARRFIKTFLDAAPEPADGSGPISRARALIETSKTERQALRDILDRLNLPDAPAKK